MNYRTYKIATFFIFFFFILFSNVIVAELAISQISSERAPMRLIAENAMKSPIEVTKMNLEADIYNGFARTKLELNFYNPNSESVAADFIFPLPQNSTVDDYSLDVNGVLVDGVMVDKNKGRVTFEAITRQNIDPGLLEKVAGNVFTTRIFPINPQSSRTIKLSYFTKLTSDGNSSHYALPFIHNTEIKSLSMAISVAELANAPKILGSQLPKLKFNRWQKGFKTTYLDTNVTFTEHLWLNVPNIKSGKALISNPSQKNSYFAIQKEITHQVSNDKPHFSEVDLVWDASHSRAFANHLLEIELLKKLFSKHSVKKVNLYLLRNTISFKKSYNLNTNIKNLFLALKEINYDGGTNFSSLASLSATKKLDKAIFIFSDGQDTFGPKTLPFLASPTYIFSTNQANNSAFNQQLATQNKGNSYYLINQASIASIVNTVGKPKARLTQIRVLEGDISGLPNLPISLNQESLLITGKLLSKNAKIELIFEYKDKILSKQQIEITKSDSDTGDLAEKLWAQQQIDQLAINKTDNKEAIIQLSKAHMLVTDFTSLIVLENLDQYLEYQIQPPKSLPQMRKDYLAQKKLNRSDKISKEEHLENIVKLWQERKTWWNTDYPLPREKVPEGENEELEAQQILPAAESQRLESRHVLTVPEEPDDGEMVVITGSRISREDLGITAKSNISLPQWQANATYLKTLGAISIKKRLTTYYQLKQQHIDSPAFYFDVAAFFFEQGESDLGLQVLSNIAELKLQDSRMLRTMAMRLKQYAYLDLAIETYKTVLVLRPEEPQSYRDFALTLALRGHRNKDKEDVQRALELLYKVVSESWDRFEGIQVTAITELNRLINKLDRSEYSLSFIDDRFIDNQPVQLRIVSSWDTDLTDIDLWVIEPSGEKVTYDHTLSHLGGKFHQDYTDGYGPEEYLLKKADRGTYEVRVHYFGNHSPEISGAATLFIDVFINYSTPNEKKKTLTLRLEKADEEYLVGEITI